MKQPTHTLAFCCFENLSGCGGLLHFISTRMGGASSSPYDSLNLAFHVGDDPSKVLENRRRLAQAAEISPEQITTARQVHGGKVVKVTQGQKGRGALDPDSALGPADGLITDCPGACLTVLTADCVPLLFFDPKKKAIGAAHAGWRGTLEGIAKNTVRALEEIFGCRPKDILASLGPAIGPCCYEVGPEVASRFGSSFLNGKNRLDLWKANESQLLEAGIPEKNIENSELCTSCHAESFFSVRAQKGATGRFASAILLK